MMPLSLQSKLDELISLLHTYRLIEITRVSLQSKLDKLSYSSFYLYEIRVICSNGFDELTALSNRYVRTIRAFHSTSIAMKFTLFSSTDSCETIRSVHPTSLAMKPAPLSSSYTLQ